MPSARGRMMRSFPVSEYVNKGKRAIVRYHLSRGTIRHKVNDDSQWKMEHQSLALAVPKLAAASSTTVLSRTCAWAQCNYTTLLRAATYLLLIP
jgi:hypothetical protein